MHIHSTVTQTALKRFAPTSIVIPFNDFLSIQFDSSKKSCIIVLKESRGKMKKASKFLPDLCSGRYWIRTSENMHQISKMKSNNSKSGSPTGIWEPITYASVSFPRIDRFG